MESPVVTLSHSEECERAVLACLILDPGLLRGVHDDIRPDHFYIERHTEIYQAILAVEVDQGAAAIDLRTLQAELEDRGKFELVGGVSYLAGLDMDLPDLGGIERYVATVKDRYVRRRVAQLGHHLARDSATDGRSTEDLLNRLHRETAELEGERGVGSGFESMITVAAGIDFSEPPVQLAGIGTGLADLDRYVMGLQVGHLIIIGGRPGHGKTSLALGMALGAARGGLSVGFVSLEMTARELMVRAVSRETEIPFRNLRLRQLSPDQRGRANGCLESLRACPLAIDADPVQTIETMSSNARKHQESHGLDLLVVDYLGLVQDSAHFRGSDHKSLKLEHITTSSKRLAKSLDIPVILLHQLSREVERRTDKMPQLQDLRWSGAIEQDADVVLFTMLPWVYSRDEQDRGLANLIVAKNRHGETGLIESVGFVHDLATFRDRDRQDAAWAN